MTATIDPSTEQPEDTYDYPWIRAWGQLCNYAPSMTDRVLRRARAEGAPATAVTSTFGHKGWLTLDDVTSAETRVWLLHFAQMMALDIPEEVMEHWLDPSYDPERNEPPIDQ
jgi:hypothetical protein